MKARDAAVLIAAAVVGTGIFSSPALDRLDGVSLDSLFWLRNAAFGPRYRPDDSPVAVIAIDEETYRRPPFQFVPRAMWTDQIATVLDGVIGAGAKVVGFDVIFPTSVEKYIKGFDRKFLISLRRGAQQGKVVLGKVQHEVKPVSPHPSQSFAVGNQKNIRNVNVFGDEDDIIRRVPLFNEAQNVDGSVRTETSMALELASRALGVKPSRTKDGRIRLGGYVIPGSAANSLTINFDGGDDSIPTYSLADIFQCVGEGREAFLKKHFQGKVVMIGAVLDVEDRTLTSKRFIARHQGTTSHARCVLPQMTELIRTDVARETMPGVYVHAAAINNLIRGDALRVEGRWVAAGVTFVFAALVGLTALVLPPLRAGIASGVLALAGLAGATILFQHDVVVSLVDPFAAGGLAFVGLLGYRAAVSDRDKRYIRRVFSYYLPGPVIERMVSQDRLPTLGGEAKEVTILFSDIASFTTLSEGLDAGQVARFLNDYLTAMSDVIEAKGGFIEKFVADEITGVFGAPVDDPDHAASAVEAALINRERLRNMRGAFGLPPSRQFPVKGSNRLKAAGGDRVFQ